jgi:hypothetical protein
MSNSTCVLHNETDLPALFDNENPVSYQPQDCTEELCKQTVTGYDILTVTQVAFVFPNGELDFLDFSD